MHDIIANLPHADVFGLRFFAGERDELIHALCTHLTLPKSHLLTIVTPNPEQVVQQEANPAFRQALLAADLKIPDGTGIVWASQWLARQNDKVVIAERVTGVDVIGDLLDEPALKKTRMMIIGGRGYDQKISQLGKNIVWSEAYQNAAAPTELEEKKVIAQLQKEKPEIVFVAFGAPAQELWLVEHRQLLEKVGVKIAMACGGAFDFLLGILPRAPKWIQQLHLEWLFRLILEPWRIKRQLRLFYFLKITLSQR